MNSIRKEWDHSSEQREKEQILNVPIKPKNIQTYTKNKKNKKTPHSSNVTNANVLEPFVISDFSVSFMSKIHDFVWPGIIFYNWYSAWTFLKRFWTKNYFFL